MQPLPGFRDFLPNDWARQNYIFGKWWNVARRYGFVQWEGPALEPTELYTKKSGPEIVGQLFNFTDKGEREVALRPELTPSLARVVAAHDREFKKPLKWFSIPHCFRYEKQQRGRLREHYQFNADIIGEASLDADVEMIALCVDLLRGFSFGATDFVVRISDRAAWVKFLRGSGLPEERNPEFLSVIDKLDRRGVAETKKIVEQQFGIHWSDVEAMLNTSAYPEDFSPNLTAVLQRLQQRGFGEYVTLDFSLVRGLAYYTGIVFEAFDRGGKLRALAGGGRYDNLISHLSDGALSLPAIGFAMGDVVLAELIDEIPASKKELEAAVAGQQALDIYVVIAKEERRADAVVQIQSLREAGFRVDYPLAPAKVGKQFQAAEQLGARLAILFGDEWPQVAIKSLATGKQELVPAGSLLERLGSFLR